MPRRRELEERHTALQEQYEKLAQDAQGEIIKAARLVATTLARFRTVKAVLEGPYDVVLIDEVGAATLPEMLLAVAKASKCAVLLGDFMQLGPILPSALEDSDRTDIQRWLVTDPFRHCGITTRLRRCAIRPAWCSTRSTASGRTSCGWPISSRMTGCSRPVTASAPMTPGDPEIVLVDTDGLHELAQVRRVSSQRRLVGRRPAAVQGTRRTAPRERRDHGGGHALYRPGRGHPGGAARRGSQAGDPLAEVGTAHRFQGREFPVVVFDTVEPWHDGSLWIGQASRLPGSGTVAAERRTPVQRGHHPGAAPSLRDRKP